MRVGCGRRRCFIGGQGIVKGIKRKSYYYTKTFGSRVADGVYETLLDGLELQELWGSAGVHVEHYLFIDDHFTWWQCGKSYLCRIVDMMHMRLLKEAIFGREALTRVPAIVHGWLTASVSDH